MRVQASGMGLGDTRELTGPSCQVSTEDGHFWPESGFLPEAEFHSALSQSWDFLTSRTVRNKCLLFKIRALL